MSENCTHYLATAEREAGVIPAFAETDKHIADWAARRSHPETFHA